MFFPFAGGGYDGGGCGCMIAGAGLVVGFLAVLSLILFPALAFAGGGGGEPVDCGTAGVVSGGVLLVLLMIGMGYVLLDEWREKRRAGRRIK